MEALLSKKRVVKGKVTRLENNLNAYAEESSVEDKMDAVAVYAPRITELSSELNDCFNSILTSCKEDEFVTYEKEYHEELGKLEQLDFLLGSFRKVISQSEQAGISQRGLESAIPGQAAHTLSNVKLPRIELPSFSGDLTTWLSFRDMFEATIHNNSDLSNVQKLQYLKSSLLGNAATLLQSVPVTDVNYVKAWQMLNDRYQNELDIIYCHLDRLFNQAPIRQESSKNLRRFLDMSVDSVESLRMLKEPVDSWDTILVYILRQKLDPESLRSWELSQSKGTRRSFREFQKFLEDRACALEAMSSCKQALVPAKIQGRGAGGVSSSKVATHLADINQCPVCSESHRIYRCQVFQNMPVEDRQKTTRLKKLCLNCLRRGHFLRQCQSRNCFKCQGKHHSLLHSPTTTLEPVNDQTTATTDSVDRNSTSISGHLTKSKSMPCQTLLPTAIVAIKDRNNQPQRCRVLLDSGSQSTFIKSDCVQRLGLHRSQTSLEVSGLSSKVVGRSKSICSLKISSLVEPGHMIEVKAHVLQKITCNLPQRPVDPSSLTYFKNLKLADPSCTIPGSIDVLLGADVWPEVFVGEQVLSPDGSLVVNRTIFGWVLSGKGRLQESKPQEIQKVVTHCAVSHYLKKFWEIEEVGYQAVPEDHPCDKWFKETTTRNAEGRYVVRLPFRSEADDLGSSKEIAVKRLLQVENRFRKSTPIMEKYRNFMEEYESMNHMEAVEDGGSEDSTSNICYLPHHAVYKQLTSESKFRIVFDASAKTSSGVSLNDRLIVGPTIQDSLVTILLRYRMHRVALSADISKMYRQIRVQFPDTDFQRIVWRASPKEPIQTYRLLTVTYGTASAPYLATRCLQQLVEDEGGSFPQAATIISKDFYMDDLLSGANTIDEALGLQTDIISILNKGGFELRKWCSNEKAVLENVPSEFRQIKDAIIFDTDESVKALGLQWHPSSDAFSFKVDEPEFQIAPTKRRLLSDIAKMFDPLGLVAPITIRSKILLQKLWKLKIDWDEPLPQDIVEYWDSHRRVLHLLQDLRVPRYVGGYEAKECQIHGFCDASESGYAAVVYLRSYEQSQQPIVRLMIAKTRVAPVKTVSIPRLELCGALLLVQTIDVLLKALTFPGEVHCWTDSTIVLAWLNSEPSRWKTFVANRVSTIQTIIPNAKWHHVCSESNPADCASRGMCAQDLLTHEMWWSGPSFLQENMEAPESKLDPNEEALIEERVQKLRVTNTITTKPDQDMLESYSSLQKLKRITAYCLRFIDNARKPKDKRRFGFLTTEELERALTVWIKKAQKDVFLEDITDLKKGRTLKCKSRILSLSPFLDNQDLIRVGGRLRNANLPTQRKHPILLPQNHRLTDLLLRQVHLSHLHAGPQLMLAVLHTEFWILSARDAVRRHVRRCVVCCRHQARVGQQLMGDLPATRVNQARPFQICGIDYCGPFLLRASKGRGRTTFKGYVALFICFSTRAVHIELVSDLTSEAFIAALRRFISRRGRCTDIYSDCGTNFVGAAKRLGEIAELYSLPLKNGQVSSYISDQEITWHFNPPSAPHMGGLWEAGVKSVKHHLRRIIGDVILSFEEMYTVLTQIEACLNSRPLTAMSSDPSDLRVLTPGHFLIGDAITSIPEKDLSTTPMNHLSRWQLLQKITQHFWKRWTAEYLSRLQNRPKWLQTKTNLQEGDLVLIKEDNLPPLKWRLGRVTTTYPGKDTLVRVVQLKTSEGTLTRPITKLVKLPISSEQS